MKGFKKAKLHWIVGRCSGFQSIRPYKLKNLRIFKLWFQYDSF